MPDTKKKKAGYLDSTYQVKKALKTPDTKMGLEFVGFRNVKPATFEVTYNGSQVLRDEEECYINKCIDDLQFTCNRQVKFVEVERGGWVHNIYVFKIHLNKIIDKNKRKPNGKLFRIEDVYSAFAYSLGKEWTLMYILYREYINGVIPEPEKLGIEVKDNSMYIDNKHIYDIWKYEEGVYTTFHGGNTSYGRTCFNAIFDLLIPEHDLVLLILNKIQEATTAYFKQNGAEHVTCKKAIIAASYDRGDAILMQLHNSKIKYEDFFGGDHRVNNQRIEVRHRLNVEYRSAWFFLNEYTLQRMIARNEPDYTVINLTTSGVGMQVGTEEYGKKPTINYILENSKRFKKQKIDKITSVKVNDKRVAIKDWNKKLNNNDVVYIKYKSI